jgi:hypothetical protein
MQRPRLVAAALLGFAVCARAEAQTHSFLFTVTTDHRSGGTATLVHADLAYGERLFSGVGPERLEQRIGAQLGFGHRWTVFAQAGVATRTRNPETFAGQVELLVDLLPGTGRTALAVGLGGMHDYTGTTVALGRISAAVRLPSWEFAGNLRLERPLDDSARDVVDVITTMGVQRRLNEPLRIGLEAVAEDLEGLFDPEEAEGGAKLLLGPTVSLAPAWSHWLLIVGGGPVLRLTHSTVGAGTGAPRDLTNRSGYLVRTSLAYRW